MKSNRAERLRFSRRIFAVNQCSGVNSHPSSIRGAARPFLLGVRPHGTFLNHAKIARHFFRFLDQGSETSADAFSPELFAPRVEIKRSEQLYHVLG